MVLSDVTGPLNEMSIQVKIMNLPTQDLLTMCNKLTLQRTIVARFWYKCRNKGIEVLGSRLCRHETDFCLELKPQEHKIMISTHVVTLLAGIKRQGQRVRVDTIKSNSIHISVAAITTWPLSVHPSRMWNMLGSKMSNQCRNKHVCEWLTSNSVLLTWFSKSVRVSAKRQEKMHTR